VSQVALVTGAARGIGAATVARLVADGWSVVAVDRCADDPAIPYPLASRADLAAVVTGPAVTPHVADVRDVDAMAAAVQVAVSAYGGLDAVVAAAAVIAGGAPHWQTDLAGERAQLDVDLGGVLNVARVAVPALLEHARGNGRFVAVASAAASHGLPRLAAYCAAKAGVVGFVRGLAADLRGTGVTANAVAPGSTDTAMLAASADIYGLADVEEFAAQQAVERLLRPDEVAAAIAWLLRPESAAITGAVVAVDGGFAL
jgi:SDR family mycofactocin-dependent oxidoreductase